MRTPDDFTAYVFQRAEVARHNIRVRRQRIATACLALVLCVGAAAGAVFGQRSGAPGPGGPAIVAYSGDSFAFDSLSAAADSIVGASGTARTALSVENAKALCRELAAMEWEAADGRSFRDELTVTFRLADGTDFSLYTGENGKVRLVSGEESTAYETLSKGAEKTLSALLETK